MQCDLLSCQNAGWQGVTLNTTRGHFYRAALEGLTTQLQRNLQMLEKIGHFKASELLLVGGGSRNTLWNQIKANMLDIPVKVLDDAETTVAGAALFGWYGVGEFNSPEEARAQIHYQYRYFPVCSSIAGNPCTDRSDRILHRRVYHYRDADRRRQRCAEADQTDRL